MIFIILPVIVILAIVALLLIRKYTSLEFVQHARLLWRTWSIWLASAGAAIGAVASDTPQSLLDAWNSLPPDIKGALSPQTMHYLSWLLMIMSALAQLIRQPKLKAQADAMRGDQ